MMMIMMMMILTVHYKLHIHCTINRKASMVHTLREYYKLHPTTYSNPNNWFIPETYTIYPTKLEDCEREEFYRRVVERDSEEVEGENLWILKPSDGLKGK